MANISQAKRLVIKIGTSSLTYENGKLNLRKMDELCRTLTDLKNSGREIILVTSGAIGVGVGKMGLSKRPEETAKKQALAAIGQCELMFMYDKFFGEYNQTAAQILLTKNVTDMPRSRLNVQNTFEELLSMGVIPVINENDTVETAELEGEHFGDNDMLSAIVSSVVSADALVILTDTDGLYDSDPRTNENAQIIRHVQKVTDEIELLAGGKGSSRGTGGMSTKVKAARYVTEHGISCFVINGGRMKNLYDLTEHKEIGTCFWAQ